MGMGGEIGRMLGIKWMMDALIGVCTHMMCHIINTECRHRRGQDTVAKQSIKTPLFQLIYT